MKTIIRGFLILLVSLAALPLFGQTVINTFVQRVQGAGSLIAVVQTAAGGYVTITQIDDTSFLVRKINASGQKQWERSLSFDDSGILTGITQTTDGGFILAGQTGCYQGFDCGPVGAAVLIKLNRNGTVAWKKSIAETGGFNSDYSDFFASVIPMPDGGVIAIGGRAANPYLILRVTATGDVVWKKNFGKRESYFAIHSAATLDNGFIVAFRRRTAATDVDVLKITDSGNVVWKKSLKADGLIVQSVGTTANNGVILICTTKNNKKLKVVVLNAAGKLSWSAGYSLKVPGRIQSVSSPIQTPDGGYVLAGGTYDSSAQKKYGFIAKIDSSLKVASQNTLRGDVAGAVFATADGGYFLFGATITSDGEVSHLGLLVLKVNSEGILPGCGSPHALGSTKRTSFGPLIIRNKKTELPDSSLEFSDFQLSSVSSNLPVSSVCQ